MIMKPTLATKTDVVPIINVALVIVLTLMIISPSLNQADTDVDLPEARATQTDEENKVEITCTLDGQIFLADVAVSPEEIRAMLGDILDENPGAIAVVRADKNLLYGSVERIIAEVEKAKPAEISLATTPQMSGSTGVDSQP